MQAPIAQAGREAASPPGRAFYFFFRGLGIVKFILKNSDFGVFVNAFYNFEDPERKKKHSPERRRPFHLPAQLAFSSAFMVKMH
jgi:hypothetical protein